MSKYQKVLVAFDGSSSSEHALRQAFHLGGWIKVIAVVPDYRGDLELVGVGNIKNVLTEPGKKLLEQAKSIAAEENHNILANLEQGEPYDRIIHVAEEERCDLIVMGRRGISRFERALMGGSTARVIGYTNKEVLVIPEHCTVGWDNLLLAVDGSERGRIAEDKAIDLARSYQSELTAVTVIDMNEEMYAQAYATIVDMIEKAKEYQEKLRQRAAKEGVTVKTVVLEGEIQQVMADFATKNKSSMIIMGSHSRRGLGKVLMGSSTELVIGFTPCPVLVIHN